MLKRLLPLTSAALLTVSLLASLSSPTQASTGPWTRERMIQYLRTHGYFPLRGPEVLAKAKAHAAAVMAARHGTKPAVGQQGADPVVGASWQGIVNHSLTPPDPNGAIGPKSYVEIVNVNLAIYKRDGTLIDTDSLATLTGDSGFIADPMVLWDADTQRFYYNVWNVGDATMDWGFSKDDNPTSIPDSFCNYKSSFGYDPSSNFPDYPKLGQSKYFLLIGVNHYSSLSDMHADRTDLLWINKPSRPDPITTCPDASKFGTGKFTDLRNEDGSIAFTPVPAIQIDPSRRGWVVASSDIECPDICGSGTQLTVFEVKPKVKHPKIANLGPPHTMTVGTYMTPPNAPQMGTTKVLDTLDGRLEHAVSAIDPRTGLNMIWTAHSVAGGAGAQENWYEVQPTPKDSPSIFQSGTVKDNNLYVFNGAMSPDRTVNPSGTAHGSAFIMGFTTSSSNSFPAIQMVSKIGNGALSGFVVVKQSATSGGVICQPSIGCRWGDYGGATPDPASSLSAQTGDVWLTNEWTNGQDQTWNWQATP